jgi:hypothetical protein
MLVGKIASVFALAQALVMSDQSASLAWDAPVHSLALDSRCKESILDAQNRMSDFLLPGNQFDRTRLRSESIDENYDSPVTVRFWDYSSKYKSYPASRRLMADFIYGGSQADWPKTESIMKSSKYRSAMAVEILSGCSNVGIVKFSPFRTTGVHDIVILSEDQSTIAPPTLIDPCGESGATQMLNWGEFYGEC